MDCHAYEARAFVVDELVPVMVACSIAVNASIRRSSAGFRQRLSLDVRYRLQRLGVCEDAYSRDGIKVGASNCAKHSEARDSNCQKQITNLALRDIFLRLAPLSCGCRHI